MAVVNVQIRRGAYYDSVVLMHLQRALSELDNVIDAGVVMGTSANKDVLKQSGLFTAQVQDALPDDLVMVVRARDKSSAQSALDQVDSLLASRRSGAIGHEYRPKSLESAVKMMPDARWVLVSVAGRYAGGVSRKALDLNRNVFLYSDNVSLKDEIALKKSAAERGLMVMGPDCGTAFVNGIGLGFANRVRRGPIGLVAASGTGLQQVTARIHQLGSGVSHAVGTGGRDLSQGVGGITTLQGLDLLIRDPETRVIVLISKPPSARVAESLLHRARTANKPVVVDFIGFQGRSWDNLTFTTTFDQTARLAVKLAGKRPAVIESENNEFSQPMAFAQKQQFLRGLYSGGTLAYEALLLLQDYIPPIYSNVPLNEAYRLPDSMISREHTIVDLGEDEFTVGRLHPMMNNDLRIRRLHQEADDPETAVILLDVVLGDGAHPDPASELAPAIHSALTRAKENGRQLVFVATVVGTNEDPQDLIKQIAQLEQAHVHVETSHDATIQYVTKLFRTIAGPAEYQMLRPVDLAAIHSPFKAINIGLESFTESLQNQDAPVVHVDWRPPAGGDQTLLSILEKMKG